MLSSLDPYVRIKALEETVEAQRQRIEYLTGLNKDAEELDFTLFHFTPNEETIFRNMMQRKTATRLQLFEAVYYQRMETDTPELKIIDVFMHNIRRKVHNYGIVICTRWGVGYYMDEADKEKTRRIISSGGKSDV